MHEKLFVPLFTSTNGGRDLLAKDILQKLRKTPYSLVPGTTASKEMGARVLKSHGAESCQQPYKGDWQQILPQVKPESDRTLTAVFQGAQLSDMHVPNSQRL